LYVVVIYTLTKVLALLGQILNQTLQKSCALFSPKNNAKSIHPVKSSEAGILPQQNHLTGERSFLNHECI